MSNVDETKGLKGFKRLKETQYFDPEFFWLNSVSQLVSFIFLLWISEMSIMVAQWSGNT